MKQIYVVSLMLLSLLVLAGCAGNTREAPLAVDGVLDLRSWDFKQDGSLDLNGEWSFYWGRLVGPDDFASGRRPSPTGFFTIPGCWNNHPLNGKPLGGEGVATFRLKVRVTPDEIPKAVRILNQSSAYVLWINGKNVARNGAVGSGPEAVTPQYLLQEVAFFEKGPLLDIILQVANFNHRKGGVWNPIRLGLAGDMQSRENLQWIFDLLLFGSLLIMGVYHLSLYLLRKEDPSALFFAVFTLDLAVRVLVCGNYYLTLVFPHMPWELLYKIELLSVVIPLPVLLLFIASIFSRQTAIGPVYLFTGIAAVVSLVVLLAPARISCHLVPLNQGAILLAIGYILSVLARALRQGEQGAGILLTGMALFGTTAVIDILNANRVLYTIQLAPFGVFCLIFSQSFVLSFRFARAFHQVKKLSLELEHKNMDLREAYETFKENRRLENEVKEQKQKKVRARLREEKARIEKLRYQLNPHFLFNALSSIRGAIPPEGETARRMVSHLAEFSRLALSRETLDHQTVSREIEIVRHYLMMEEMRFEDYLTVSIDVEPAAGHIQIPALIIHPLVENAIKYGSLTSPDLLEVRIAAKLLEPDRLGLRVSNTGTWVEPGTAGTGTSFGIGIENIRQRLETCYSGDFRFETFEGGGCVNGEIMVPVKMSA